MRQVAPVASRITAVEQNRERLASLGTMAAGLAHELNNPAAAARRAASQLTEALDAIGSALRAFVEAGIEREEAAQLVRAAAGGRRARRVGAPRSTRSTPPTPRRSCSGAWRTSASRSRGRSPSRSPPPASTSSGSTASPRSPAPTTGAALRWVAATLTAGRLAAELCESTERMSALVGAVKSYSYMDRGELVEVDLHEGLETTLVVLGYKLKHTDDRGRARLRPHAAEAHGARLRAQPGLDEPARQRDRRARRARHDHDHDARRRRLRDRRDRRRRPRHPRRDRRADLRPVLHDQGRRARHRPRPRHRAADRRRAPRRLADTREPTRPHGVPRAAALHAERQSPRQREE